jgi:hypothetical protein
MEIDTTLEAADTYYVADVGLRLRKTKAASNQAFSGDGNRRLYRKYPIFKEIDKMDRTLWSSIVKSVNPI